MANRKGGTRGTTRGGTSRGSTKSVAKSNGSAKKIFAVAILLLIIAALTICTLLCGYAARDPYTGKWFRNADIASWTLKDNSPKDYMSIQTYSLSVDEFEAYGIPKNAIAAKSYNVVFTPSNATNKRVSWNIRWSGKKSAWSNDKDITDYVVLTAAANSAPTATLALKQPFGDTIILEAVSQGNTRIKSSINVDYVARVEYFSEDEIAVDYGTDINLLEYLSTEKYYEGNANGCYSIVPDSFVVTNVEIIIPDEAASSNYTDQSKVQNVTEFDPDFNARTGLISCEKFISRYNPSGIAKYFVDYNTSYLGEIKATITCYYKGEEMYTFTAQRELWFTDDCIAQLTTPVTNVTITPGWSAF